MASTPTPAPKDRRAELSESICDWMLEHGVAALSLRPLATALGTSTYSLIYWFGSRDGVIAAGLDVSERRQQEMIAEWGRSDGLGNAFRRYWAWCGSKEGGPYLRLFFELIGLAQRSGELRARVEETIAPWRQMLTEARAGDGEPTTILSSIAGLQLDLTLNGQLPRITAAAEQIACQLDGLSR
jgi:AcrR family transcriptional regulator